MKIWVDTSPIYSTDVKDCTSYPHSRSSEPVASSLKIDVQQVQTCILKQSTQLYAQECGNEKWLICTTGESERVAVIDRDSMSLLEQFRFPTTITQVMSAMRDYSRKEVEQAVLLFIELGFLHFANVLSPKNNSKETEMLTVWLHVTNACNLRCQYCYIRKSPENMTEDTSRKAVDAIFRSAIKHGFRNIKLKYAGGEASLHMARVIELHDYAMLLAQRHAIKLESVILSNGVVLSQQAIENLKSRDIGVMLSLDGLGAYHDSQRPFINGRGSFQYVARTIDRLLANNVIPQISITVSRYNLNGLPELIEYILRHQMPFAINYYRENESSASIRDLRFEEEEMIAAMNSVFEAIEQNLPEKSLLGCLIDKADMSAPHRHTCGVGRNYLVISQNGGVAKCQADIKRTVTTIDADDPLQAIKDDREGVQGLPVEEKKGCRTCEWRYWCTGGCPLLTYRATGRFDVKSPNCNIYKALFPKVLRLEAMRLLRYLSPIVLNQRELMNVGIK